MKKGYIHVYTGNGKGKTTAALGLSVRAACAGLEVYIGQFLKGMDYSELKLPEYFSNITMEQFGSDYFIEQNPSEEDQKKADIGFKKVEEILLSDKYDLVILDEILVAVSLGLVNSDELLNAIKNKNPKIELVLTGRNASEEIIDIADLVTEMKEIKHYYQKGVQARIGIEK
ncbi:MAG: cob(I)yrinic acid a,c-diamide adenosyltransferase [Tissierellia bacterium]|nr:cob(I)yrinic acid a,c-diamide adenosyltransferase [Tissierellia bacterium]